MPRRSRRKDKKENSERWLITYSDLITLLMIFFVIMYAMSQINQVKFAALQQSLAAALHRSDQIPLDHTGTTALISAANPTNTGDKAQTGTQVLKQDKALDNLYKEVQNYINGKHLNSNVSVTDQQRGVEITLRDVVLFDTGQAVIKSQAVSILNGLVPFFQSVSNSIVIEGYTDNLPIHTAMYPTNWELSAARAIGVVRYLASKGVSPTRLSGVGYGQYHPVVPNNSPQHRQMNRRVNIVILRKSK